MVMQQYEPGPADYFSRCLLCGDPIDYCVGHGYDARYVEEQHDLDCHDGCHPDACPEATGVPTYVELGHREQQWEEDTERLNR